MRFGILQRYIMGEVFRAFFLALVTITCVFVLMMVMAQASKIGLGPADILRLIPFLIPGSLPFTVPVSLLFAVTVVYGRLASDNEVIAAKGAGLSVWALLWPPIAMALALSLLLSLASSRAIPNANFQAKQVIVKNMEDLFYKALKRDGVFDHKTWPFLIKVKDVRDRVLIEPTFKHRNVKERGKRAGKRAAADDDGVVDMVIMAKEARLEFITPDQGRGDSLVRVHLVDAVIKQGGVRPPEVALDGQTLEMAIPPMPGLKKTIEEMTVPEMREAEQANRELITNERLRQAVAASMWIGSGRPNKVDWPNVHVAIRQQDYWKMECDKYQTETQMRLAMAWGSLFFVVIGAPVGILFARRDFLSAFISCFMPIILIYYPLMLLGVNMGKEGVIHPILALWSGNAVLWAAAWFWAIPPVMKH